MRYYAEDAEGNKKDVCVSDKVSKGRLKETADMYTVFEPIPDDITEKANHIEFKNGKFTVVRDVQELMNKINTRVSGIIDKKAIDLRYANIVSAMMMEESSYDKFAKEGRAFRKWHTECWKYVDKLKITKTTTVDKVISGLPELKI